MIDRILQEFDFVFSYLLIGGIGGLVYRLLIPHKTSFTDILKSVVVASFTGFLGGYITNYVGLGFDAALIVSGISGFAGGFGILLILATIAKRVGISHDDIKEIFNAISKVNEKNGVNNDDANAVIINLIEEGKINTDQLKDISRGDKNTLFDLLDRGNISGVEFDILKTWGEQNG